MTSALAIKCQWCKMAGFLKCRNGSKGSLAQINTFQCATYALTGSYAL